MSLWPDLPVRRWIVLKARVFDSVHKPRNLIAHAMKKITDEIAAGSTGMSDAADAKQAAGRRKAFRRKWRVNCGAVATNLEECGFLQRCSPEA